MKKCLFKIKKNDIREIFQDDYRKYFTANFLTLKAKEKIVEFFFKRQVFKIVA